MNYHYPIDEDWTTEEIIYAINFFECIEKAYESKVHKNELVGTYKIFKEIVPSKSEEKRLFKEFKQSSGYESYPVVRKAMQSDKDFIEMNDK